MVVWHGNWLLRGKEWGDSCCYDWCVLQVDVVGALHLAALEPRSFLSDDIQDLVVQLRAGERDARLCTDIEILALDLLCVRYDQVFGEARQGCHLRHYWTMVRNEDIVATTTMRPPGRCGGSQWCPQRVLRSQVAKSTQFFWGICRLIFEFFGEKDKLKFCIYQIF